MDEPREFRITWGSAFRITLQVYLSLILIGIGLGVVIGFFWLLAAVAGSAPMPSY